MSLNFNLLPLTVLPWSHLFKVFIKIGGGGGGAEIAPQQIQNMMKLLILRSNIGKCSREGKRKGKH